MVLLLMTVLCTCDSKDYYSPLVDWACTSGTLDICIYEISTAKIESLRVKMEFSDVFFFLCN